MTPEQKRAAREAMAASEQLVASVDANYPNAWSTLDRMRQEQGRNPELVWPEWCLLPMGASATVAQTRPEILLRRPTIVAEMAVAYAWRHTRSVYLVNARLLDTIFSQVPDAIELHDLVGLPEWCIAIASTHPEWPGVALWAHLEWDLNNSRPELRLLLSQPDAPPLPLPIYLDRPTLTEALADMIATAITSISTPGANVHGAPIPLHAGPALADVADHVDRYTALLAYLARPEADIVHASRPGVSPVKPRRPKKTADVWLVGYSDDEHS